MNSDAIFQLANLDMGYSPARPVLRIDELTIPRGEVVFILGASGVGKSTLLESLGLMNNTFHQASMGQLSFYPSRGEALDIPSVWSKPPSVASEIRLKYFSFIFQRSFLLPNFNVQENLRLNALYNNTALSDVDQRIDDLMAALDLHPDLLHRSIHKLSGGQQQRMSFISAFCSSFEVLFADEPTGNLDQKSARNVLRVILDHVRQHHKTCIIVSHDVALALTFADSIYLLSTEQDGAHGSVGVLKPEHVYRRNNTDDWFSGDEHIPAMDLRIHEVYDEHQSKSMS